MALFPSFLSIPPSFLSISLLSGSGRRPDFSVRMGGGPRTFPGGVSKWQWKRMQEKKAKQLLKARLMRERQIYEMRKRAELKAAVSQLERPWQAVERAPELFSVGVDEQVKTLADRFQKPGGFDMWNELDGPQILNSPNEGLPSVRFFPKGAVHSLKPYTKEGNEGLRGESESKDEVRFDDWIARGAGGIRRTRSRRKNEAGNVQGTEGEKNGIIDVSKNFDVEEMGGEKGGDLGGNGWKNNVTGLNRRKNGKKGSNSKVVQRGSEGNFQRNRRFGSNNGEKEGSSQRNGRFGSNNGEKEGAFQRNGRFSSTNNGENEGGFQRNKRFSSNNGQNEGGFQRNGRFGRNNGENVRSFQRDRRFGSNTGENEGSFQRDRRFSTSNGENEGNFQRNGRFSSNNRRFSSNNGNLRLRPTSNLHYEEKD